MNLPPFRYYRSRWIAACIVAGCCFFGNGCVGLNIPSERYHGSSGQEAVTGAGVVSGRTLGDALLFAPSTGGGPAASCGAGGEPLSEPAGQLPTVPWPRFHPVPTSAVFEMR